MNERRAAVEIRNLREEARQGDLTKDYGLLLAWKTRVTLILNRMFDEEHVLIASLAEVKWDPDYVGRHTSGADILSARRHAITHTCGILDTAVSEMEDSISRSESIDASVFDPELWSHVQVFVRSENWSAVASQVAIFVEDRVRKWCGRPTGGNGHSLVGKGLYGNVLADNSDFRLGKEPSEWEGWRAIGTGFAQALGNVDRHNIQSRDDAKRYAFGVLGVGSLLLTQLRFQYSEMLDCRELLADLLRVMFMPKVRTGRCVQARQESVSLASGSIEPSVGPWPGVMGLDRASLGAQIKGPGDRAFFVSFGRARGSA